jgi:hypothetical protein
VDQPRGRRCESVPEIRSAKYSELAKERGI